MSSSKVPTWKYQAVLLQVRDQKKDSPFLAHEVKITLDQSVIPAKKLGFFFKHLEYLGYLRRQNGHWKITKEGHQLVRGERGRLLL